MLTRLTAWLHGMLRRRRIDAEVDEELAFHLQQEIDANVARGMSSTEARRAALRDLGGLVPTRESVREVRTTWFETVWRDIRFGARTLRRRPGFALVAILTLALGIGANTAIFSLVDAILLRPLPVRAPDQLTLFTGETGEGAIGEDPPPPGRWTLFSSDAYEFLRDAPLPLASVAAVRSGEDPVAMRLSGRPRQGDQDLRAQAHLVSGTYFAVMGVDAAIGRTLTPADDRPDAAPVAVVSDGFWRTHLGADPDVVGTTALVNGTAFTIVGVTPPSFFGERLRRSPDLWVPLVWQPGIQRRPPARAEGDLYWLNLIGRLEPGQTLEIAQTAVTTALRRFLTNQAGTSLDAAARQRIATVHVEMVSGARGVSGLREQAGPVLRLLLGAVSLVLLIACANVAMLFLARSTARQGEAAVRRALGATRWRLVRQWFTESALLAALGTIGGVSLAWWLAPLLLARVAGGSTPVTATIDGPVLAFTTIIALLACLLFGLVPALQAGRSDLVPSLRPTGRGHRPRRRLFGVAEPFVIGQIAISLVLVVGATLLVRSLLNLEQEDLGFDANQVLLAGINPRLGGYTPATVGTLYQRIDDQVSSLPGVERATLAAYGPFSGLQNSSTATIEGYVPNANEDVALETIPIGPAYPQTLGIRIVEGRAIDRDDGPTAPLVAVVNEAFVRRYFPTGSPLGHHLSFDGTDRYRIVGVLGDARFHGARSPVDPVVFTAIRQATGERALDCEIEVRARGNTAALAELIRKTVAGIDSRVPVTRTETLRAQVLQTFGPERQAAGFIASFAGLALLLAAIGLYGVVAQGVARRTHEIGIRVALGAARRDVLWLLVRETLVRLAVGLALGLAAAAAARQVLASRLFGVTATDPASLALAVAVLAVVAIATTLLPAAGALRIDPARALRAE